MGIPWPFARRNKATRRKWIALREPVNPPNVLEYSGAGGATCPRCYTRYLAYTSPKLQGLELKWKEQVTKELRDRLDHECPNHQEKIEGETEAP